MIRLDLFFGDFRILEDDIFGYVFKKSGPACAVNHIAGAQVVFKYTLPSRCGMHLRVDLFDVQHFLLFDITTESII